MPAGWGPNGFNPGMQPTRQPSAGDGFRIPAHVDGDRPGGYEPFPGFSRCMLSLKQLIEGTLAVSDLAPHVHAPYYSSSFGHVCKAVVNIDAADNAAANAAGIALHAAQNAFAPNNPVELVTAPAGTPGALRALPGSCIISSPAGHVTVIKSWGATVVNNSQDAAKVSVSIRGGPNTASSAPDPRMSSGLNHDGHQPTMIILPEPKQLTFSVANLDPGSPLLIQISVTGWRIPVRRFEDSLKSMLDNPGYGVDC